MAHHDKIMEHKMDCPECNHPWNWYIFKNLLDKKSQEQINWVCYCNTTVVIRENINGFLVMRKYIKRKDKVKRIAK